MCLDESRNGEPPGKLQASRGWACDPADISRGSDHAHPPETDSDHVDHLLPAAAPSPAAPGHKLGALSCAHAREASATCPTPRRRSCQAPP